MESKRKILAEKTITNESVLKVCIDKKWNSNDFIILFEAFNALYNNELYFYKSYRNVLFKKRYGNYTKSKEEIEKDLILSGVSQYLADNSKQKYVYTFSGSGILTIVNKHQLFVKKISYGSPGEIHILGIGKVFDSILEYIKFFSSKKERALDLILKELETEEKEQNILRLKIENLKQLGLSQEAIFEIIGLESKHIGNLNKLLNNKQITDFEIEDQ
jgi:hypothetical protein